MKVQAGKPARYHGKPQSSTRAQEIKRDVQELVRSVKFDIAISVVIFLNSIIIGIEQALELGGDSDSPIKKLEHVFLTVYVVEILLRIYAQGLTCFEDNWVKFDLAMVVTGVLSTWVIEPAMGGDRPDELGLLFVFRTARLLRLGKTGRVFRRLDQLRKLMSAFLHSFSLTVYTFGILFIVMYIFGVMGVELITKHKLNLGPNADEEFQDSVELYFKNLPTTMMTLINFATLDNMSAVWLPLLEKDAWLSIYFVTALLVMGIIFMNIVSAVIFISIADKETLDLERQKAEQDAHLQHSIHELKELFYRIDIDNSGSLSREEVLNISPSDSKFIAESLGMTTKEVFQLLDVEGTGQISINDFFERLWNATIDQREKKSLKMQRMEMQVEMMHWRIKESFDTQEQLKLIVQAMSADLIKLVHKVDDLSDAMVASAQKKPKVLRPKAVDTEMAQQISGQMSGMMGMIRQISGQMSELIVEPTSQPDTPTSTSIAASTARRASNEQDHKSEELPVEGRTAEAASSSQKTKSSGKRGNSPLKAPKAAAPKTGASAQPTSPPGNARRRSSVSARPKAEAADAKRVQAAGPEESRSVPDAATRSGSQGPEHSAAGSRPARAKDPAESSQRTVTM